MVWAIIGFLAASVGIYWAESPLLIILNTVFAAFNFGMIIWIGLGFDIDP